MGREMHADARRVARARTRLRAGKLVGLTNDMLADCRILDRSGAGWRVRLLREMVLPRALMLYEDETRQLSYVEVVWQRGEGAGLRRTGPACGAPLRGLRRRLGAPFFAAR